ncbi:ubiquinol-cytochrome C chaperone family protein [Benzoatithermus flavus]|uniref:Ubiquinol-cytochrome C chaperone family protein n=1 Tax=Benzoatithermus flavus TaxID=3108223 RepID=A0ABU8XUX7_9PROT
MARSGLVAYSESDGQSAAGSGPSWWQRVRSWLRGRRARRDAAHALYVALVEQARTSVFYAAWGVPDSRDGRLEMVMLHAILVMRRLRHEGAPGLELAQALFDVMFADLDRHLREWGVGDLSVGKHVKKLAQSFFGRAAAIDPLLDGADPAALDEVLRRNVYTEAAAPDAVAIRRLGTYLCDQDRWLARGDGAALLAGRIEFARP